MDQLDYNLQQQQQQLMLLMKQLILLKNYSHPKPNHPPSNNGEFFMTDIVLTIIMLLPVLLLLLQALQLVRFVVKAVYIAMKDQKYHKAYPTIVYWSSCQENDDDKDSSSSRIQNLKTEDIDKLASEIAMALQHFCIPESQFAIFQGGIQTQQELFDCIGKIEMLLEKRAKNNNRSSTGSSHDGALLTRFRQHALYTPRNIQALFHMCDPDIRTGPIQSRAFDYLTRLGSGAVMLPNNNRSIWKLEILPPVHADKHCLTSTAPPSPSSSSSFGLQLITVAAKALLACPTTIASSSCSSTVAAAAWRAIDLALVNTVLTVSPCEMMQLLGSIDWTAILQKGYNENGKNHSFPNHCRTFVKLHQWARRLLAIEPDNATAKAFLQDKLGSCHGLLRQFLCQIIQGQQGVVCCADAADFLLSFGNCLVPQPIDHETVELVCQARDALIERCLANTHDNDNNNNPKNIPDKNIRSVLDLLERWQVIRYDESDQSRLLQFRKDFMLDADDSSCCLKKDQHAVKKSMKNIQKIGNANINLTDGEMCANCAILETHCQSGSAGEGGGLLKCSRCRQIMYCSRKCQVEHWNKGHQNHCERVKYYSFSPYV